MWQLEPRDGAVRSERVLRVDCRTVELRRRREALVRVVGVTEMLKADAPLATVGGAPPGGGPEGVEVLVHVELSQRVRRVVDVLQRAYRVQEAGALVERRGDV